MTVHVGERLADGILGPCYLLDGELALLLEGWCPFLADVGHQGDGRLEVREGWAWCESGDAYRYPPSAESEAWGAYPPPEEGA